MSGPISFNLLWDEIYLPAVKFTHTHESNLPDGPSFLEYVTKDLIAFMAHRSENAMDISVEGDETSSVIYVTPNLMAALNRIEAGIEEEMPTDRLRIQITIEDKENPTMSNFYRVTDADGERHLVTAENGDEAVDLVTKHVNQIGGKMSQGARAEYLTPENVGGSQVLSGPDPDKEDTKPSSGSRTTGK